MRVDSDIKLDYQDVLIRPKKQMRTSQTASRSNVDLIRKYKFCNSGNLYEGVPVLAANMSCVGTFTMAKAMAKEWMGVCLNKHYSADQLIDFYKRTKLFGSVFYTIGINNNDLEKLDYVINNLNPAYGRELQFNICVDSANGYLISFEDRIKLLREKYPKATLLVGNVGTPEMVQHLIGAGADIVKVGIGSGSVCTTRLVAGVGYPQLSATIECADAAHGYGGHICSDGGIQCIADICKSFAAGADFVMLGGLLGGHTESEGKWIEDDGNQFLEFFGMSSEHAQEKFNGGLKKYRASEGKCVRIPYKGPVGHTLQQISGGLRSACSYVGADMLKDLSKCTTFIRVNRTHNTIFGDSNG